MGVCRCPIVLRLRVVPMMASVLAAVSLSGAEPPAASDRGGNLGDRAGLREAHNRERAAAKLPPLTASAKLDAAALAHARDMAESDKMTHEGRDGSTPAQRIERQDYHFRNIGENVAAGQGRVSEVMRVWMDS